MCTVVTDVSELEAVDRGLPDVLVVEHYLEHRLLLSDSRCNHANLQDLIGKQ